MASDRWDGLLANSRWYVPASHLLAYRLDSDSPGAPIPAGDQTLWSIGEVKNGRFSGRSVARITDAEGGETQSLTEMEGLVTRTGQVRITFTTPVGSTITGIGQLRRVEGRPSMEMQMISGGGGSYTTHWAYMLRADADTVPPEPGTAAEGQRDDRSSSYRWLLGTTWSMAIQERQKSRPDGLFTIEGYRKGYFWGSGSSAAGPDSFEVLGSVTPEGNFFFNAIDSDDFSLDISQGGMLTGARRGARVRLHPYDAVTGQEERPLTLRLLSSRRSGLSAPLAADRLIHGGMRAGKGQRMAVGRSGRIPLTCAAAELASMLPLAPSNATLSSHTWLEQLQGGRDDSLDGLTLGDPGRGWPL